MTADDLDDAWGPVDDKVKKKKGKKSKGKKLQDEDDIPVDDGGEPDLEPKAPTMITTAEELADEVWGPVKEKGKGKKGNKDTEIPCKILGLRQAVQH